jgi:hypothetical protein
VPYCCDSKEPGTYGLPCSQVAGLPAQIDIGFTDTTGKAFNLTIPSAELSVGPFKEDPSTCQMLVNAYDGLDLVGGSLLKYWYTVYDFGNKRMGFALAGTFLSPGATILIFRLT